MFGFLKRSKTSCKCSNKNMIFFPEELVEDILLRMALPLASGLKLVCKEWKLLIESPRFIECYHRQAEEETNRGNNQLVSVVTQRSIYTIELDKLVETSWLNFDEDDAAFNSVYPVDVGGRVIGCCNGMLCLRVFEGFLLYNPCMQACHTVPAPPRLGHLKPMLPYWLYGFGYDRSTYDYKIVSLGCYYAANYKKQTTRAHVYSLNRNSWKPIEGYPKNDDYIITLICCDHSVFFDGAIYWVVGGRFREPIRCRILRFDLSSERFSLLPWQGDHELYFRHCGYLDVLDGCLCTWVRSSRNNIVIWKVKRHSIEEESCWIKVLSISTDAEMVKLISLSEDGCRLFLAEYRNPSSLGQGDTRFCWYDIETSTRIREIKMLNLGEDKVYHVATSIQSKLTLAVDKMRKKKEDSSCFLNRCLWRCG